MKTERKYLIPLALAMLLLASCLAYAQPPSPCNPCVPYCSFTQGAWGSDCNGGNTGCLRDQFFSGVYPSGVTVGHCYPGCSYWIHITSSARVDSFLPQSQTPAILVRNYTNPGRMPFLSVFAGQVLALQLNVDYSSYPPTGMTPIGGLAIGSGPFAGMTVSQLLALANDVLGGNLAALPPGTTLSDLNAVADSVNNNFDDCVVNHHYLTTPASGQTVYARQLGQTLPISFCLNLTAQCPDICVIWWCQGCNPAHDFATFTWAPGCTGPSCNESCTPNPGVLTGFEAQNQQIIENDPTGNGCWWYALVHADAPGCFCVTFESQLPVELQNFAALPGDGEVTINWTTASERNNSYFEIQRANTGSPWATIGNVNGQGTVTTTTNYSFVDNGVTNGTTYSYRLMTVDLSGHREEAHGAVEATPSSLATPKELELLQNYPNPFNATTTIRFEIVTASHVRLEIVDPLGREVAVLIDRQMAPQSYQVNFDASHLSSGIYFYRLNAGSTSQMHKMILLK